METSVKKSHQRSHAKPIINTLMTITCTVAFLFTACGDKSTPAEAVPTSPEVPAPPKQETQDPDNTQREKELFAKAEALIHSLKLPYEIVLQKPAYAENERVHHFVTASCRSTFSKMTQAAKVATNLFNPETMSDLCENLRPNLTLVPGKYFLNEYSDKTVFSDPTWKRIELILRPDFTVGGYQISSRGGRNISQYEDSAVITADNRRIVKSMNRRAQSFEVKDLSGRFEYSRFSSEAAKFGGNRSAKVLVYPHFEGLRTLEIKEESVSATTGILTGGSPASTKCSVFLKEANGNVMESVTMNRACFEADPSLL
jgi:hypothetical protein